MHYFIHHILQIVESFPVSLQSIHFNNLHQSISLQQDVYLQQTKATIAGMNNDASKLIDYYLKMVQVCWHVSLSSKLTEFLLKPFQQAIHDQPDWILSLFLVISRDYPEMLTNPAPSVDWKDDWGVERLLLQTEQTKPTLDLFQSMIQIAGITEVWIF